GGAARAGAHDRSRNRRAAASRRGLRRCGRHGGAARTRAADAAAARPRVTATGGESPLLIRDLAQVVSPAGRRAPLRGAAPGAVRRHRRWMLHHGTTTFEGKSGYGLDRETELASLRAIRAEGGVPTWLGAHAVPPEFETADEYLDFALAEVLPAAAELAEAADVFVERGAFDAAQARRYLTACREADLALRLHGDQFTEQGAIPLAIELGARSVDHLEATGEEGGRALAASDVVGVLLPASALFLDRPMPPARALVEAGAAIALATDFNPGSAFCESLPVI